MQHATANMTFLDEFWSAVACCMRKIANSFPLAILAGRLGFGGTTDDFAPRFINYD